MSQNVALNAVYNLLQMRNATVAEVFKANCLLSVDLCVPESICAINQYFRDSLARRPYSTMDSRSYLIDDCSFDEWLSLLERGVIPEVLK